MSIELETTITVKGQVTVPAAIREQLDLKPGDKLRFQLSDTGELRVEPRRRRSIFDRLDELELPSLGRPLTESDIDDAVAAEVEERHGPTGRSRRR